MNMLSPRIRTALWLVRILCTVCFLLPCALEDVQRRRIDMRICAVFAAAGLLIRLVEAAAGAAGTGTSAASGIYPEIPASAAETQIIYQALWQAVLSMLPGLLLLLLAFLAAGAAGTGDGIGYLTLGILQGADMTWMTLFLSLVLASVCSLVLLSLRKAKRGTQMPFMTFTAAGWVSLQLLQQIGITW